MTENNQDTKKYRKKTYDFWDRIVSRLIGIYKNLPIRVKFMIVLNLAILIPFITLSLVSYKNTEDVLKNKSIEYSSDILKIINLRLDDYLGSLKSVSTDLLTDTTIYQFISSDQKNMTEVQLDDEKNKVKNKLKNKLRARDEMQGIAIYYGNKNCTADKSSSDESIDSMVTVNNKAYLEMEQISFAKEGSPAFYLLKGNGNSDKIFYCRAILDPHTYRPCGMILILVDQAWFSSVFNGLINYDMRSAAIISPENDIVLSHFNSNGVGPTKDILKNLGSDEGFYNDNKSNTLTAYVTNNQTNWKIATFIPLSTLYSDVDYVKTRILISLVFAVIFLLLISFYISWDFISSINKLVVGMQNLQDGYDDVAVELNRKDELGFMGDTFNTMVKEIATLQKWVIREKLTRKDAQIKALQSQINPHFLFNTLESINWMAQLNNVPEISVTVTALASLMEASIARDGKLVTLKEELEYIDNYIIILKQRFQDKLELHKNVDETLTDVKVPRLIIQPIVENAANHGVANSRGKGIVDIEVKREGKFIDISVFDNGIGIEKTKLAELRKRLEVDNDDYFEDEQAQKKHGIGLENVNRRIKLFYGSEYGLKIESELGEFTKISMKIPIEAKDRTETRVN